MEQKLTSIKVTPKTRHNFNKIAKLTKEKKYLITEKISISALEKITKKIKNGKK